MSRAITFMIISIMMFAMPSMMSSLTSVTMTGAGDAALNKSMADMVQSMTSLIGSMSYIMGIAFGFKGVLAFKEYAEYGDGSYSTQNLEEKNTVNLIKNNTSDKEKINLEKEEKLEIKPIVKEEFKFNLDFEHELLNKKLSDIEKIISFIISLPALENDIESKLLVSSAQTKYITEIHKSYTAIPKELRDRIVKESTATALTMEQLILIENGLRDVENELLSEQLKDLNIMNRFLREKFPDQEKKYITLSK